MSANTSLQAEIVDCVALHHAVYGMEITGPLEEQFFRWLRPLWDADQEVVEITAHLRGGYSTAGRLSLLNGRVGRSGNTALTTPGVVALLEKTGADL